MENSLSFSFKIVFWLTKTDSPQPVSRLPPPNLLVDHVLCDSVLNFNEAFVMLGRLPFGHFHQDLQNCLWNMIYYMATTVRALWLATKRVRFSCNDLALLAGCPGHGQSVFNFIMDIHATISSQLSKKVSANQCHMTVSRAQVYNSLRWRVFKVIRGPIISLNWSQGQDKKLSLSKKLCLVVSSASLDSWTRPRMT